MASIPLPALHINPPQPAQDPLENYARLMQLRNQSQMQPLQMQAAQQQVEAGDLANQKTRIELNDQKALSTAIHQWGQQPGGTQPAAPGGATPAPSSSMPNYDELIDLAKKNGASYSALKGLQDSILGMKEKAATIAKSDAQTGASNAETMKKKNGMIVDAMNGVISLPDDQLVPGLMATSQQLSQQGLLDPQHMQMAQQLAQSGDPKAIRQQLDIYAKSLGGYSQILSDAQKKAELDKAQGASDLTSPFYAPSSAAIAMGTAPGAAQIQAGEVKQAAAKAGAEERARMPGEMALASQKQALSQGDPKAAAQLMIDGDATLSELKSRGATPEFIAKTLFYAHQLSGGRYNAPAADAQFDVAKSQANTAFFGSAGSLVSKGGTLDQLAAAAKDIPQGQIPVFNSIADAMEKAKGSGPIAKYAALVVGASDDYSKVMGGGTGSDSSRAQALNLIPANASPEARAAAIEGIRGAVGSQMESRIGANPTMQRMYGTQLPEKAKAQPQASGALAPGAIITQNGHKYKVTAVDANGKPTSAEPL